MDKILYFLDKMTDSRLDNRSNVTNAICLDCQAVHYLSQVLKGKWHPYEMTDEQRETIKVFLRNVSY